MNHTNNELPTYSFLIGDFDARCPNWCNNDITNANGRALNTLKWSARYEQIINEPSHTENNLFSCIDLIFCNNLNIISNYVVNLSIFEKCHHNIIFEKINIRIPLPPSYVREVWDYRKTNVKSIQKILKKYKSWVKAFGNLSVDGKVDSRNERLVNIFWNYIPNKNVKCSYCQSPCMNDKIKKCLRERSN